MGKPAFEAAEDREPPPNSPATLAVPLSVAHPLLSHHHLPFFPLLCHNPGELISPDAPPRGLTRLNTCDKIYLIKY